MALSQAEINSIGAIIVREGGLGPFTAEVSSLWIASRQTAALATLAPAITVTVQDWAALSTYVAQSSNVTLYAVMAAITAAAAAQNAAQLGPLFVALYAAVKVNQGL
jgi:hypothetical protein